MEVKKLLKQSQLHGLNKIPRGILRWVWLLLFSIFLWLAVNIVKETIVRYFEKPTFMAILEKTRKVMEFPLVQVCPEVDFPEYKMDDFLSKSRFPADINITYFRSILRQLSAFYSPDVLYNSDDLEWLEHLLDHNHVDVYTASLQMTLSCKETLLKCRWQGLEVDCQHLFFMELTSYGFCCVFNGRSLRREIAKYGIHRVKPKIKYYTKSVGITSGLIVAVNQSCVPTDISLSYKWAAIDGGQNYVEANINGTPLSPGTELWMGHYNKGFGLSYDAKILNTNLRGCHLTTEGLTLFPVYHNRKYCQLECKMAYYLKACGCVLLTFPAPSHVPRCRANKMDCIEQLSRSFSQNDCICTHTCDVDTDHVKLITTELAPSEGVLDKFYDDLDFSKVSVIRVFIIRRGVKTNSRRSVYTHLDLFAQLGGVFNLFFGVSILSVLELLQLVWYYLKNRFNLSLKKQPRAKVEKEKRKNKQVKVRKQIVVKEKIGKNNKAGTMVRFNRSETDFMFKSRIDI